MKHIYWRPQKVSAGWLAIIGLLSLGGFALVETARTVQEQPHFAQKLLAARHANLGMKAIREELSQRGHAIDSRFDPSGSGLIGDAMSPVTTLPADLASKQTTVNPNLAAVFVDLLREAGIREGD